MYSLGTLLTSKSIAACVVKSVRDEQIQKQE